MATIRIDFNNFISQSTEFKEKVLLGIIVIFMIIMSINIMSYGFNYPIIDMFGFRQAQTAITSYWLVEEGYKIDYITPILGPPWSIPFEFPVYQYIVSCLHEISGLGLDQSGRVINILFFYTSASMTFFLLRALRFSTIQALVPVLLFLGSPFYLFWSRSFMIESTALAFGLGSILFLIKSIKEEKVSYLCLATVLGCLSSLTKITTFGICLAFMSLVFLTLLYDKYKGRNGISYFKLFLFALIATILPIVIAVSWNYHADFLKSQNSLATFIMSGNLSSWNFGTIEKKLALKTWLAVLSRGELIVGSIGFVAIGFISLLSKKAFLLSVAALVSFLIGPAVFTNLYVVHEYYFYANGLFLLLFISGGVIALLKCRHFIASGAVMILILFTMQYKYYDTYPKWIKHSPHSSYVKTGLAINKLTKESDVVIIYGSDWDSSIPYYSKRKVIMDRAMGTLDRKEIKKSLEEIGHQNIGAVVLCDYRKTIAYDDVFRQSRVEHFDLNVEPVRAGKCDIYHRNINE
ncbi:glycosyltransferase family 39 protein [Vibrio scophthalmi]|uniref:glycosyltransferase family 39 protein n=1 Tax=Vibrio scophthalmi TaxID=45658 RepID=UPI003EBD3175